MRVALAQINSLIGDLKGNGERIKKACIEAERLQADLLLTPELSLWGYPPRDLLLKTNLISQQNHILEQLVQTIALQTPKLSLIVGLAEPITDQKLPNLFNSLALINSTGWAVVARKQLLPTYDVFDEKRYFRPSQGSGVIRFETNGSISRIGLTICEDLWVEKEIQKHCLNGPDPIEQLLPQKIDLLINFSASPFSHSKNSLRQQIATKAVNRLGCPLIYLNQIGANDELVFDGASFILNSRADLILRLPSCKEIIEIWDSNSSSKKSPKPQESELEQLFQALVLGVRDYAAKCGFKKGLLGLSGGIDSALVAVIASAALGSENITAILMPSPWNSSSSINDASALARRLDISTETIPIDTLMAAFESALAKPLKRPPEGVTAENLQSRIRGTLLMAFANQNGHLLLSTGNKSELAVGYCTLYGDMNGGLAVIGDVYKTIVFELCEWLDGPNSQSCRKGLGLPVKNELISKAIRNKPPSAELRPNQLDKDSLPDYNLLDPLLKALVEERMSSEQLCKNGYDPELVEFVQQLLKKGEFKRRQAPPLLKVTSQAFGSGWRIPIASA